MGRPCYTTVLCFYLFTGNYSVIHISYNTSGARRRPILYQPAIERLRSSGMNLLSLSKLTFSSFYSSYVHLLLSQVFHLVDVHSSHTCALICIFKLPIHLGNTFNFIITFHNQNSFTLIRHQTC